MATVVYLDADDEITSAASRIRIADEKRIALVVPYGSRLATSRINFRLLAREAQARGHRLSVVAGDAATRALAASAGLPVFASVNEYEEAETTRPAAEAAAQGAPAGAASSEPTRRRRRGSDGRDGDGAGDDAAAAGLGAIVGGAAAKGASAPAAAKPDLDATQPVALARGSTPVDHGSTDARSGTLVTAGAAAGAGGGVATTTAGAGTIPGQRTFRLGRREMTWRWGQTGAIVAAGLVALGLLAIAVAAFVFLPSAQAVVTLRLERMGPVQMEIRADPAATAIDAEAGVIPAQRLTFDVAASGLFPATGTRVEETRARGEVTFLSKNPVDENNIGVGAVVSTPNGIQFKTTQRITIPKATIVGLTVIPGEATVGIEAVAPGPEGNVAAQAITVVPSNEDPTFTEVRNRSATSGGTREEFPLVQQADIDAAIAQLRTQLDEEFSRILADPGRTPPGLTVFGESRELADPLPTTDVATLVGQEGADFALGLSTTGSVTAVNAAPVTSVAAERIGGRVEPGYRLVDGSIAITPGEPTVSGQVVQYPVSATAAQIRILDPAELREEIKGKPIAEARAILEQYGDVQLSTWPNWVSSIPTIDARLDVRVDLPAEADQPAGSPALSPPPAAPTGSAPSQAPGGSGGASAPTLPSPSTSGPSASPDDGPDGESPAP